MLQTDPPGLNLKLVTQSSMIGTSRQARSILDFFFFFSKDKKIC